MNALLLGIFGLYFVAVGFAGNAPKLAENAKVDLPGFVPWAFSLAVILVLSENENTERFAKPFLALLVLNFVLSNWGTIASQTQTIYQMSIEGAKQ